MIAKDYILDNNDDLQIQGGDFVCGDSDVQHLQDILLSQPGDWRQSPMVGVAISKWINAPIDATAINKLRKLITLQCEMDGMRITELELKSLDSMVINVER